MGYADNRWLDGAWGAPVCRELHRWSKGNYFKMRTRIFCGWPVGHSANRHNLWRNAERVLGHLACKTQVLFFTHHQHLIEVARKAVGDSVSIVSLKPPHTSDVNEAHAA
jgi:hypothetical protein